jgi:peptidyl-prolyl cis-trans isomerase C
MRTRSTILIIMAGLLLALVGCNLAPANNQPVDTLPAEPQPLQPTDTPAPSLTPTPEIAFAALVNGEGIRMTSYDASLLQFNQALEDFPDLLQPGQTAKDRVLQELINRILLAQAAREAGFTADLQMTVERLDKLIKQAGSNEAFELWLTENGYTLETFSYELPLEIEAAWQRDQIAATVPDEVEQVQARQMLFYDPFLASRASDQLKAGFAFETIAANNDPNDLGYLDWFPPGVLLFPELEEAAFSLQPGQHSEVIETKAGYHILYVIDKGLHPLSNEIRLILEERAVGAWLEEQRSQANILILIP